ncbi:DUF6114 domain-containing protein [Phaeacidiphilus oryzae]|uniref:DUF6114 domain-containing protein n=1 Tax=Phaeacidiphilus oryzae TaxID=348818 RepID=UPI0007C7155C|nr:DUF6114 domain-containing protein [Phaeacidiphilus oryzae]
MWRKVRPFWAGVLLILAALPILYFPYFHLSLGGLNLAISTTAGAGSLVIGILLIVLGICMWFQPQIKIFGGVAAILLSLVSLPVSNFGGFFLGLLLGLIGGALAIAWAPLKTDGEPAAEGAGGTGTVPPPGTGRRRRGAAGSEPTAGAPETAEPAAQAPGLLPQRDDGDVVGGDTGAEDGAPRYRDEQSYGPEFFFGTRGRTGGGRHGK